MAKHLEIINENNNVIIDDQFKIPMLIWKGVIRCDVARPWINPDYYDYWIRMYSSGDWTGSTTIFDIALEDAPFLSWFPFDNGNDFSPKKLKEISSQLFVAIRSVSGDMCKVGVGISRIKDPNDPNKERISFKVRGETIIQNDEIVVAVYSHYPLRPRNHSLTIYNEQGLLIYDALRPPLHFLGSMYGGVDASRNPAAVYNMPLPPEIDPIHVLMTGKSTLPYWAAYRIHSGGVSWADTQYKAVLSFPDSRNAQVTLWRVRGVNGNNSSYARNLFFENLIYCPYPMGNYF